MGQRTADNGQDGSAEAKPLTAREAAASLGLHERTIRRAIGRGDLTASKIGGVFQIVPIELARYRESHLAVARRTPRLPHPAPRRRIPSAGELPVPITPLIGREREVSELQVLLRRPEGPRLLVLTGPGGVGKTRLALHVAAALDDAFADGVAFVPLAAIRDPTLVAAAIAKTVGVQETGDRPLAEQIAASLADKHLLLVLDNFEQVVEAGPLVGELLSSCPRLTALVTSRARLRLSGEHDFPVSSLAIPESGNSVPVREVAEVAGVRLFVDRAQAVDPGFALMEENAAAVVEVCRRLEGMPLAIELAAARIAILPPAALLARLDRRLPLLTGGARDAPHRHRTMRDAIAWSYDLLSPAEQDLFRRLAVFVGGCALEAAEAVGGEGRETTGSAASPPERSDPLELIASLLDNSLLRQTAGRNAEPRFEMLETIREYGLEQLHAHGEMETARRNHAAYFVAFAEGAEPKLRGQAQIAQLARQEAEHDNLRAALTWSLTAPDRGETALRLVGALHWFWFLRDYYSEGRRWLAKALAGPAAVESTPARVKALAGEGLLAIHQDDYPAARARLQQSIDLGRKLGDTGGVAYALLVLGWGDVLHADHVELRSLVEECVALFRVIGDSWGLAAALCTLGMVAIGAEQPGAAVAPFAESLALSRALGDTWGLARTLHYSGELARSRGDDEQARVLYEECIVLYRELDHRGAAAIVLHNLGYVIQHQGDPRRGLACFVEALSEQVMTRDRPNIGHCHCLGGVAGMAALLGQPEQAARLFGATTSLLESIGASIWSTDRADYVRNLEAVRSRLGQEAFAVAFAAGQTLSLKQAVAEAAAVATAIGVAMDGIGVPPAGTPIAAADAFGLTPREFEILRFVAHRRTDREIANSLSISPRTVMHHVSHILAKLGVANRRDVAIVATQHDLV